MIINKQKENMPNSELCCPGGLQGEKQIKSKERKVLVLCLSTKKTMEHKSNGDANCNWCAGVWKGARRVGNWGTSRDHPNYSIIEIGQNTEKSPGNLGNHLDSSEIQSTNAGEKSSQGVIIIIIILMWQSPPQPPHYINFFEPFRFLAGDQLVVPIGASHISS